MKEKIHNIVCGGICVGCAINAFVIALILSMFIFDNKGGLGLMISMVIALIIEIIVSQVGKNMIEQDEDKFYKFIEDYYNRTDNLTKDKYNESNNIVRKEANNKSSE